VSIAEIDTKQILSDIRSGKQRRDAAVKLLFQHPKMNADMRRLVSNKGGSENDFKTVRSLSLMQFVKTAISKPDLMMENGAIAYMMGIARYMWYSELATNKKHKSVDIDERYDAGQAEDHSLLVIKREKAHLLREVLSLMGAKCKEVLLHWANGYKMAEIAAIMQYSGEDMAKKKKYQCMKKLLAFVADNPHIKEALR